MNLRRAARGEACQIRLVGICNGDDSTTVLCHFRMIGISGMGLKPPDWLGAWGCSSCHAYVDSNHDIQTQYSFAQGVLRTQNILHKRGLLSLGADSPSLSTHTWARDADGREVEG